MNLVTIGVSIGVPDVYDAPTVADVVRASEELKQLFDAAVPVQINCSLTSIPAQPTPVMPPSLAGFDGTTGSLPA